MSEQSGYNLIDRLEQEINRILEQNRALKAENRKLVAEAAKLTETAEQQHRRIEELSRQVDELLLKKSLTEVSGGVRAAKVRINRLLREVDRCIALMNK